jgi:hypothetical protein
VLVMQIARKMKAALAVMVLALALGASPAMAAAVTFFHPGGTAHFTMLPIETRETYFEVLRPVHFGFFGADIDPLEPAQQFRWRVFASNAAKAFGPLLYERPFWLTDEGERAYDIEVDLSLPTGFFILQFVTDGNDAGTVMDKYTDGGAFVTTDGNFRVIDGGLNGPRVGSFGNSILPAFSVALTPPQVDIQVADPLTIIGVDEPAPLAILGVALMALGWRFRRQLG